MLYWVKLLDEISERLSLKGLIININRSEKQKKRIGIKVASFKKTNERTNKKEKKKRTSHFKIETTRREISLERKNVLFFHPLSRRRDSLACTKLNLPLKIDASRLAFIVGEFRRARVTPLRVHLDARACAPILNPFAAVHSLFAHRCRPIKDNSIVSTTTISRDFRRICKIFFNVVDSNVAEKLVLVNWGP